jgi:hypothetical protein
MFNFDDIIPNGKNIIKDIDQNGNVDIDINEYNKQKALAIKSKQEFDNFFSTCPEPETVEDAISNMMDFLFDQATKNGASTNEVDEMKDLAKKFGF